MEKKYTSKDILEMLVEAKERGVKLYMDLARNSENYHVSELFAGLAKDEKKHKLELEKWLDYMNDGDTEEAYPGERSMYLKALVEANTFNCNVACEKALKKTINEEEAVQAGISFEKDLMLFLHDLKQNVEKKDANTIDALIDDEIRHLREMFYLKEKINKKKRSD